jgi:hypothetical protein
MRNYNSSIDSFENDLVYGVFSLTTIEMQNLTFFGETSPEFGAAKDEKQEKFDYRLIGDELMIVDRENLPPGAVCMPE